MIYILYIPSGKPICFQDGNYKWYFDITCSIYYSCVEHLAALFREDMKEHPMFILYNELILPIKMTDLEIIRK